MNLAGLFDPVILTDEDGGGDYTVWALGDYTNPVTRWGLEVMARKLVQADQEDAVRLEVMRVDVGEWINDRDTAEAFGYAWCVNHPGDDPGEWKYEMEAELRLELELHAPLEEGECVVCGEPAQGTPPAATCYCTEGDMRPDWRDRVNANPERYPYAPLGPFPGAMITVRTWYE